MLDTRRGAGYLPGRAVPHPPRSGSWCRCPGGGTAVKLIKQVRLEFRQGTSDKVYEVDLCEVGPGQYVVNYRYGRRGTTLRDGSKTAAPVPRDKAESVF